MKKKLLYTTSRFPFPLEKGDKLRAFHQIKHLSEKFDIYLVSLSEKDIPLNEKEKITPYVKELKIFKTQTNFLFDLSRYLFSSKPIQLAYFHSDKAKKYIHQTVNEKNIDLCFCQLFRTAELCRGLKIPKVLDYMDAFSEGFKRQAKEYIGPKKMLYNLESKRIKNYEKLLFQEFNKGYIISSQDKDLLGIDLNVLKNGIDSSFLDSRDIEKNFDLCFVGNMSYPPNVLAAEFLVKEILPLVHIQYPETKVLIAGAKPNTKVLSLAGTHVKVSGWMDDIRDAYSSSKLFVAPLFIGTGLQNKLLEAMAQEIPCITTDLCNNALEAKEGSQILLANSREAFAEHIIAFLNNPNKLDKQVLSAKSFIESHYDWNTIGQELVKDLESLL